ncbi:restriction endonuclease subunit M [Glaciecola punicea]|uniref:type I restriction-modification system subunit M n=1 Tax=Glaciecola punicea TaxID=56804 RepID=UPI0008726E42|nr:class I SAM-dependent DNA methyltransferase [Glaciecola punicea]OFA33284.1 restriction endonuclease subunit M [Glaciecola punicea]
MSQNGSNSAPNNLAAYCWSIADLLRGDFRQSQYGRIILPFTLLRRLECVLEGTKDQVLNELARIQSMNLPEEAQEKLLLRASGGLSFFNTSKLDLARLSESSIKADLISYVQSFSKDAREIFEYFNFAEFIGQLNDANLLYKVVQKVSSSDIDLSPQTSTNPNGISNHDMGLVFEELIRRFAESSNDTAGEHFTPRDIVRLTTALVFMEDDEALTKPGIIRTIYDPTAGTGGFLSSGMEYVHELNPNARMVAYGQELNPESYAICKADMLIKGQEVTNIKLGNTLSSDHLYAEKFDYMLSNPPFGVDWKKIEEDIKKESTTKGFDGRFGAGLPRVSDGSLLFLMHLISKLRDTGARIGIILNGSPLFTGGAGSGESEIRRYILETDLLETIVALPNDMFYNTGIATYIWVLSNKKVAERKGKVQLINGANLYGKMRKSLGSKRNEMGESDIATIIRTFGSFDVVDARELDKPIEQKSNRGRQSANPKAEAAKTFASKIFDTHEFGYRRITIERPLRESYQFSDERIAELRFANKPLNAPMKWAYEQYGNDWLDDANCELYGQLQEHSVEIRAYVKSQFSELKEKQIKDLLDSKTWLTQKHIMLKAKQLQSTIGTAQCDDMNTYETVWKAACKAKNLSVEAPEKKQITSAVSWKNPAAEKVIKKVHNAKAKPLYGLFAGEGQYQGKVLEFKTDGDLRDNENVALDPRQSVNALNEAYFLKEVYPHVPEAWIDASKTDAKDGEIGIVGYEIPFNRHFYLYQPPRDLAEIDADLDAVSAEIMSLLQEVHS